MSNPAQTTDFAAALQSLRARIDAVDDKLIALFQERIGIIHEVALLKRAHTPNSCHIRPAREGQMHKRIYEAFRDSDFNAEAAVYIWRHLISASTHLESPLSVISAAPAHLGREYFGTYVIHHEAGDSATALKALDAAQATIAILPMADVALLAQHPTLKIFAALPVIGNHIEAVAVAALSPEPSGEDVSYFLAADGHVAEQAGFSNSKDGAVWLGTHPAQLRKD